MTDFNPFKYINNAVAIDDVTVCAIPSFKNILDNDKNNDKKLAFATFLFLYLYCDLRSPLNKRGLSDKDAYKEALKLSNLPQGWTPDDNVNEAIKLYVTYTGSLKRDIYLALKRSFKSAHKVIEKTRAFLETKLEETTSTIEDIKDCQIALKQILDLSTDVSVKFKQLDEAESLILKSATTLRGGKTKRDSHDPDNES